MQSITIVAIGSIKDAYFLDAANEYIKRIQPFCKLRIQELAAKRWAPKTPKQTIQQHDQERIAEFLKHVPRESWVLLDDAGTQRNSLAFAHFINSQKTPICFILGGPMGFNDTFKKEFAYTCSLSPLTMPHDLARIVLLEQIYRAGTIAAGKTYHY